MGILNRRLSSEYGILRPVEQLSIKQLLYNREDVHRNHMRSHKFHVNPVTHSDLVDSGLFISDQNRIATR